jgi:hypothetical protein
MAQYQPQPGQAPPTTNIYTVRRVGHLSKDLTFHAAPSAPAVYHVHFSAVTLVNPDVVLHASSKDGAELATAKSHMGSSTLHLSHTAHPSGASIPSSIKLARGSIMSTATYSFSLLGQEYEWNRAHGMGMGRGWKAAQCVHLGTGRVVAGVEDGRGDDVVRVSVEAGDAALELLLLVSWLMLYRMAKQAVATNVAAVGALA